MEYFYIGLICMFFGCGLIGLSTAIKHKISYFIVFLAVGWMGAGMCFWCEQISINYGF